MWRLRCTKDHEAAGPGARKLGVRLAPFVSGSCVKGLPRLHVCPWLRFARPGDGADDGSFNTLLGAMP